MDALARLEKGIQKAIEIGDEDALRILGTEARRLQGLAATTTEDTTDDELAKAREELAAALAQQEYEDTTALGRGLSRGVDVAGRGFGSTLEGLGSVTDIEALEKFGAEMVAENEAQLAEQEAMATRLKDVEGVGTGLDYFLETLGETAPQTGLSLGAGAAAGAAAGTAFGPAGTIIGGLAGAALSQIPFFYGNNREAQKEAIQQGLRVEMSESAAFLNSLPQAALDAFAERLMVGRLLPTQKAIRAGGLFTRVAKGAGTGAAVEVPTELGQTLIERAQAGLELDSEEAIDGYIETAVAAGLIGGTLGGGAAGISRDSRAVEAEQRAIVEQEEQEAADAAETAEIEALLAEDAAADDAETAEIEALLAEDADAAETAQIEALLAEDVAVDDAETAQIEALLAEDETAAAETADRSPVATTIEEKEDSEALTVPPVTLEQDPAKQRYSILQQVIEDTPTNNYTTLQRAFARRLAEMGVADTAITEAERNTIVSAVNVQRAPEEVESRGPMTVRTIEDTSIGTAEIEERIPERQPVSTTPVQASFPNLGRKRGARQEPDVVEEAPAAPVIVTKELLDDLGVNPRAGIRQSVTGKDIADPEVREQLIEFANNPEVAFKTRENVAKELESISPDQLSLFGQKRQPAPPVSPTTSTDTAGSEVAVDGVAVEPESGASPDTVPVVNLSPELQNTNVEVRPKLNPINNKGDIKKYTVFTPGKPTTFYTVKKTADRVVKDTEGSVLVVTQELTKEQLAPITALREAKKLIGKPKPEVKVEARTKKATVAGGAGVRGNLAGKPEKEAEPKKGLAKRAKTAAAKERAAVKSKEDPTLAEAELEAKRKAREAELQEIEAELVASGLYIVETDKDREGIRQVAIRKQRERRFDKGVYNIQAQFDPDLDAKLDNNTLKNIKEGNLKGALTALAYATDNPRVAKIASKLTNFVGDTRVVIVPAKPTDALGKRYRAALDEEANTKGAFIYSDKDAGIDNVILLDDTAGVTAHNLLHEMAHAATIQELQKPSSATTRQLTNLYNYAKPYMDGYYGSESVEEFVAEVFGNYKFRQHLATIPVDGDKTTVFQRVLDTIKQFIRRITGTPSDVAGTADRLIEDILAPYEGVRGSGILYNSSVIGKAKDAFENMYESVPTFKEVGERGIVKSLLAPVPESAKKFSLGLLDLNAITKIAEGKLNNVKELLRVVREQSGAINKFNTGVEALTKRTAEWAGKNVEKMQELSRILTRSTYLQLDPTLTLQEAQKKYGKDPDQLAEWKNLRDRYNKLGEGQNFYKAWRNQYKAMYDQVRELMDSRLSADVKNPADRKVLVNKLYEKLTSNGVIDPYFPLMRTGKFWLEYNAVDPDTGNIEYYVEAFTSVRERKEAIKQVEKHWSNPDAKNKATVEKLLADTGKTKAEAIKSISGVNAFASLEQANFRKNAPPTSFVNNVLDILEAGGIDSKNPIQEQIMRLFLDTLPERSFANSFRHRKNRRGAMGDVTPTERQIPNHDIIFGLRNRALNLGQQLSRIKYGAQMRALQDDFKQQAADINSRKDISDEDKKVAILLADELGDRAAWAASPMVQPWARLATSFGFNMTLGLNISSALVNLSQIPMVVVPYLGAQYGYGNTAKALQEATKIFMGSGNKRKVEVMGPDGKTKEEITAAQSLDNYDFDGMDKNNPLRRFATLSKLADDLGQLNRSIAYDIADVDSIDNPMAKVNSITGFIFHHGERANRQVAMIMAYDLALQKKLKDKGLKPNQWEQLGETELNDIALDALNVTEMTNGGIAAAAAPRIARDGIGKVAFLFKRYGSAMYFMLYDLIDTSFTGNEKARKIARAQLRGVFGGAALVAGVQGLPFFGVVAMISNMFKEDDEEDFETSVRKYIGEGPYGGVVNYLFGVDVASRMGLSNLIFRDRMIEKDQSVFFTAAEQLGGPVLGSLMQMERGAELWGEGEMLRGIEAAMPAAIRNGFKSVRFANEGARTLRGDPIVEDFHVGHVAAQFMGFAPAEYTRQLQQNASLKKIDRATNEERTKLLRKYYVGMRNNNVSAVQRIMEDMVDFNSRHPEHGITPDTVKRSMAQHMRTTAKMHYGVTLSPRLRSKLQDLGDDWDDSPTFASDFGL